MRRFSKRNKSPKNLLIVGILLISVLVIFLLFKLGLFNIKKVDVETGDLTCVKDEQLIDPSAVIGKNFFFLDIEGLKGDIKQNFICVKNVVVSRLFPGKIKIKIDGRKPSGLLISLKDKEASVSSFLQNIATPSSHESLAAFLVDDEGVIFAEGSSNVNLPRIFIYNTSLALGQRLDGAIAEKSLKILDKAKIFGLNIQDSLILDNFFVVLSPIKIIFRLDGEIDTQIASLQLILEKAKMDSVSLEFIDLRFDKPIVKFAPKKN